MTRRNLELLLLVIAAPLVIVLFAMLLIHDGMVVTVENLAVPLGIFGAFLVAHIAVRIFAPAADPAILPITFALSTIGIAFVTRIVPDMAVRQLMWLYAGIACMVLVLVFLKNIDRLAQYKYVLVLLGILLLLSPMLPVIGTEINGSRLWLRVGSFSFQPGELAKICIVLFLAGYLALNRELLSVFTWRVGPFWLPDLRTLMPMVVMWLLAFMVVVLEKDLGLALVLFAVFLVMLYCATGKKLYVVTGLLMAAVAAVALYGLFSHVQLRVSIWLDPFADAQNTSYQLAQCLFSIADGGMFGTGEGSGDSSKGKGATQTGRVVVHPFVKKSQCAEIIAGLIPEFADMPTQATAVAPVAMRRAILRRTLWQGPGFWLIVATALFHVLMHVAAVATQDPELFDLLTIFDPAATFLYAVGAVCVIANCIGAIMWARESSFAVNRRFMQVSNGGLSRESVSFPRPKIQFGCVRTNPFQRMAKTATLKAVIAAGVGGTTISLIDVTEEDAAHWMEWLEPRK